MNNEAMIHDLDQGTPEWHALRLSHYTASEAPAMMAQSALMTRTALLDLKKLGVAKDVTDFQQRLFDRGHATEATARSVVEDMIGEDLFAVVMTRGLFLASLDGQNLLGDTLFEHKMWNKELVAAVEARELPAQYWIQLEQQLYVSGAERVIFVVSDGTRENLVWMEYRAVPGRWEQIEKGWAMLEADLANHVVVEEAPKLVAKETPKLPALAIVVEGAIKSTNMVQYKASVLDRVASINTDLKTDQDFVDAAALVKFFKEAEVELQVGKKIALAQTADIDELFRTVDELVSAVSKKRIELEKIIQVRKTQARDELKNNADSALAAHVAQVNAALGGVVVLPKIAADFGEAIKGKRNLESMNNAITGELIRAKNEATAIGERYKQALFTIDEMGGQYPALFTDRQYLVTKSDEDLVLLIESRLQQHEQSERDRLERERVAEEQRQTAKLAAEQAAAARASAPVTQDMDLSLDFDAGSDESYHYAPHETPAVQVTSSAPVGRTGNLGGNRASDPVTMDRRNAPASNSRHHAYAAPAMVTISAAEHEKLLADSALLASLHAHGVDNWEGYSDAVGHLQAVA